MSGAIETADRVAERVVDRLRSDGVTHLDLHALLGRLLDEEAPLLDGADRAQVGDRVLAAVLGLGPLDRLLVDGSVTDVIVNADGAVWVERAGELRRTGTVIGLQARWELVERALAHSGVTVDRAHPIADARLADGSRLAVVVPPVADGGPVLAIRRFVPLARGIEAFGDLATADALAEVVRSRANAVVYGPTGAGKTALLNALSQMVGADERVLLIEDTPELDGADHIVRLATRRANNEGTGQITMRDLVRTALRLRPDRIVVGEVRGAEALDMVWALSTGHTGSFSTIHARSAADALARLETFCLLADASLPHVAVQAQVRRAVDVVIGVGRCADGRRQVLGIHDVPDDPARAPIDRVLMERAPAERRP